MNLKYPWQLYHWHFEVSGKCTLQCPRCPRNEYKGLVKLNQDLSLDFFKRTLTLDLLQNTVKRITFCGDIGDPIYNPQFIEICKYIKETNPRIHIFIITNGSHKKESWWRQLAQVLNEYDTVNFSVDGFDNASNNLYRINSNWDSIITGMRIMSQESKCFVYWALIVFKFNQYNLDNIRAQAETLGVDALQITKSTKFGSKYGDAYGGETDPLEPDAEFISKTHRYERSMIKLTSREPLNTDYLNQNIVEFKNIKDRYNKVVTPMCLIGNRGLYVNSEGTLFPCSWTSFPYKSLSTDRKTINFEDSFFEKYRYDLNLVNYDLETVLNNPLWDKLFNTFDDENSAWVECEQKCNSPLVDYDYAVGWLTN